MQTGAMPLFLALVIVVASNASSFAEDYDFGRGQEHTATLENLGQTLVHG